jgi:hypothetical protein
MILDDGGDATLLVHKGVEFEKAGSVPAATDDEHHHLDPLLPRHPVHLVFQVGDPDRSERPRFRLAAR